MSQFPLQLGWPHDTFLASEMQAEVPWRALLLSQRGRACQKDSLSLVVFTSLSAENTDKTARGSAAIMGSGGNESEDESDRAENGDAGGEQVSQKAAAPTLSCHIWISREMRKRSP